MFQDVQSSAITSGGRPTWDQYSAIGTNLNLPLGPIDFANGQLSLKAGKPIDFRTMDPDTLADLIEASWPDAAMIRQNAAKLKAQAQGGENRIVFAGWKGPRRRWRIGADPMR